MNGFVYFLGASETRRVKIGFTVGSPHDRMRALQTGSPEPLEILAVVPGPPALERQLHERFAAARVHGEWFAYSPDLAAFLLGVRLADPRTARMVETCETPLELSFDELEAIALAVVARRAEIEEAERAHEAAAAADDAWETH